MTRTSARLLMATTLVLAAGVTSPSIAAAPTATTQPVTDITATTARFNATVNPNGEATRYAFQYGLTTTYSDATTTADAGSGTADVPVTTPVTGLTPNTTYHARVRTENASGIVNGQDVTFTTPAAQAPGASTGAASAIRVDGATVTATVNPRGAPTSVVFEYGTSQSYGTITETRELAASTSDQTVTVVLNGLAANTTFNYRVRATSVGGTTNGANRQFKTSNVARPSISGGGVTGINDTTATITANVNPRGRQTRVLVQYGRTTAYDRQTQAVDIGNGTANVPVRLGFGGLAANSTHNARIVAISDAGTTNGSNRSFRTRPAATRSASLFLAPAFVRLGEAVRFAGAVSGTNVANARVQLQSRPYPQGGSFRNVGNAIVADAGGAYNLTAIPSQNTDYRVRVTVAGSTVNSAIARALVRPFLSVRTKRLKGGRIRFSGSVRPGTTMRVSLQRRTSSGGFTPIERTLSTVVSATRGTWSITIRTRKARRYRVVAKAINGSFLRVVSSTRTVR